jgi:hypothetical protein
MFRENKGEHRLSYPEFLLLFVIYYCNESIHEIIDAKKVKIEFALLPTWTSNSTKHGYMHL